VQNFWELNPNSSNQACSQNVYSLNQSIGGIELAAQLQKKDLDEILLQLVFEEEQLIGESLSSAVAR
jgi:hypothetical protein